MKIPGTNNLEPLAKIPAQHNNQTAENGTEDQAKGLQNCIHLCKGASVILTNNLSFRDNLTFVSLFQFVAVADQPSKKDSPSVEEPPAGVADKMPAPSSAETTPYDDVDAPANGNGLLAAPGKRRIAHRPTAVVPTATKKRSLICRVTYKKDVKRRIFQIGVRAAWSHPAPPTQTPQRVSTKALAEALKRRHQKK
ncbi:uncharacterized protein LOC127749674 [Frankliniella occidentalis]|uniref:Uncharacterized protein LOC127749674 n=1 Tax=Frankliniella occidentalis TaxID=133901 RepID=A0A9C6WQS1_FRAOC|nr:uncharacterized protein LOC127749674 [Frankliniella occidentalis]